MMYLEYDWSFNCYRPRFGQTFIDWRGYRYFQSLADARYILEQSGAKLGKKVASRTWKIELINQDEACGYD